MTHEEHIREQGRIARELAAERRALFEQVPFAPELEREAQDLERIARPVMAVVGAERVGKSALIDALGTGLPWKWLELGAPGDGEPLPLDHDFSPGSSLPVGEMAEHCVVVFSAGEPPSRDVLTWLEQLCEAFPEGTLQGVLTRCDRLPSGMSPTAACVELSAVLRDLLPQRTLPLLAVSGVTTEGLEALRHALARQLAERQRALLRAAFQDWRALLVDLRALLSMKDLARVKPETLSRLRLCLEELLLEEEGKLGAELEGLVEESGRGLGARLPETQRRLERLFREQLVQRLEPRREALRQQLGQTLARELARDVEGPVSLEVAERFAPLLEAESLFFDGKRAGQGGLVGVGAALLAGAARRKHGGWALVGAALVGGVLAGLLGKGERVRTPEELQRVVGAPLLEETRRRLEETTRAARGDIERLCTLLQKVSVIFSPSGDRAYDAERLAQAVTQAEGRHRHLDEELEALRWKHRLEGLDALMKGPDGTPEAGT